MKRVLWPIDVGIVPDENVCPRSVVVFVMRIEILHALEWIIVRSIRSGCHCDLRNLPK